MTKNQWLSLFGVGSVTGLVMLPVFLALAPAFISDDTSATVNPVSVAVVSATNAQINSILGLSVNSNIPIDIMPDANSSNMTFNSNYTELQVTTNSETGYVLQMKDTDGINSLIRNQAVQDNTTPKIESVTSDTLGSALTNQWGYNFVVTSSSLNGGSPVMTANTEKMASSIFHAIPTMATTIRDTSAIFPASAPQASTDVIQVNYGVGVSSSLPSGVYTTSVTYTATTNVVPDNFYNITYMDEMTHAICANTTTPAAFVNGAVNAEVPETVLIDRRDGQSYVVRKLADGNCWMSQNLAISRESIAAYDPSNTDGTLVASLTDTTADTVTVKMPVSYYRSIDAATTTSSGWNSLNYNIEPKVFLGVDTDGNKQYIENGYNWNDTSTDSNYNANGLTGGSGELNGGVIKTTGSAVYAIGNYYNWYLASLGAEEGNAITTGVPEAVVSDMENSICPKNWTLPSGDTQEEDYFLQDDTITASMKTGAITTGFDSNDVRSHSFVNLTMVYGMARDRGSANFTGAEQAHADSMLRLVAAPLSFPLSGFYMGGTGQGVAFRGTGGWWFSATTSSDSYGSYSLLAYGSYFHRGLKKLIPAHVAPRMSNSSGTIRCVAR